MIRSRRKDEHLELAHRVPEGPLAAGFDDIWLLHQALPELNLDEIDISVTFLGKKLDCPLVLNALTGGSELGTRINRDLAWLAARHGLAMAVGSQTVALDQPLWEESFSSVRDLNPQGLIIANLGAANARINARKAVEMIKADALQIHFNVPQELAMAEGDRCFKGIIQQVKELVQDAPAPIIAKEVGFGMSRESAWKIYQAGVRIFDVGGSGGTNFIRIEDQRSGSFNREIDTWGIPTVASLAEVLSLGQPMAIIASGGIRSALHIAKCMALGAGMCGVAGWFLKVLMEEGRTGLDRLLSDLIYRLKAVLLMSGAANWQELQEKPLLILGETAQWLQARGIHVHNNGSVGPVRFEFTR